ncbi:allophanate hydrolase subunit 1 [Aestuariibacter sp. AA17]|uniref:Allophanate hydrolase subunit 1 n=1 Tax=Fluctibacter corallii TaxID=2984329 RepID=A0ABT3A5T7_9ALTE|nr:allophanate hydrolase subunit 1 [Aestuariibacter sp. AA17]MCV2883929.1 allophanate hydrolase subunit 1 [Aestuariibacter sp. AA17]
MQIDIFPASEDALIVYVKDTDGICANQLIGQIAQYLLYPERDEHHAELSCWLRDVTPSYHSILVRYNPLITDHFAVKSLLQEVSTIAQCGKSEAMRHHKIPVYFGMPDELDWLRVSHVTGLSQSDYLDAFLSCTFRVFALGFAPGFGFLGTLPDALRVPRLDSPRKHVPAGALAIAESQTAIYPSSSPGGWNLIGRTAVPLFCATSPQPNRFRVGDSVSFTAIDLLTYEAQCAEVERD